jgi:hypothetical protein
MKRIPVCSILFAAMLTGCQKEVNNLPGAATLNSIAGKSGGTSTSAVVWQKCLGTSGNDNGYGVAKALDGDYFVVGSKPGVGGYSDAYIAKINYTNGKVSLAWDETLGGNSNDDFHAVVATADGGCLATGYSESSSIAGLSPHASSADVLLVKYSASGTREWVQLLGGSSYDRAFALVDAGGGSYALAGQSGSNDGDAVNPVGTPDIVSPNTKMWVLNFSINTGFTINWQYKYGASTGKNDVAYGIVQTSSGGFVINGRTLDNSDNSDIVTVGMASDGSNPWTQKLGGSAGDVGFGLTTTSDNGVIVTGYINSADIANVPTHGQGDMVAVKYASDGTFLWAKAYGGSKGDGGRNIINSGKFVNGLPVYMIIGDANSNNGNLTGAKGSDDLWIVQIDSDGNFLAGNNFGGTSNDSGYNIIPDGTGTYTAVGTTSSKNGDVSGLIGGSDIWALQVLL